MNSVWESSGRSWKDSAFGLWSQKKKTTAKVQRMFSIDSQKKNFKLENAMPIKVQEVHRTPDYFESMHFFQAIIANTRLRSGFESPLWTLLDSKEFIC